MKNDLSLGAAVAVLLVAGAAQAQRLEVDPARATSYAKPIPARPGELIASDISDHDFRIGPEYFSEHFVFSGRVGETVTAQVKTDVPTLEVLFREKGYNGKTLARGSATAEPVSAVLPKDGDYYLVVSAKGPQRQGKYLLAFGAGGQAPSLEPPKPRALQGAAASQSATSTIGPAKAPAPPLALPKLSPPPGVLAAEIGASVSRPAAQAGPLLDLYQFIGEAGATLAATAAGSGHYGITLFTPEGAEMLSTSDQGSAKLTAVLPQDAVYILAVAREEGAKPYRLSLAAEAPDLHLWSFRQWAGYESLGDDGQVAYWTCWTEPGAALQYNFNSGGSQTLRVARGGAGRWDWVSLNGPVSSSFTTRIDGEKFIRTSSAGQVTSWSPWQPKQHGRYRGYVCPPPKQ